MWGYGNNIAELSQHLQKAIDSFSLIAIII
jgi:hypothetical protein